ncbi:uncharacterized protein LOC142342376 [Convolutriloba macropyga]|uniref:uncharacterized protein LOC142342376 n=1 Tax=Convolutriloba macropyga TaxID=536237 RepID=UPI003F51D2C7
MFINELDSSYSPVEVEFPDNTNRKNYFLAACKVFIEQDSRAKKKGELWETLHVMDEKSPYGGIIGSGNSKLDYMLKWSKIFRLHAAIHDAAGQLKTRFNIGPGYPYCWPFCPVNSPLLGHFTGLFYCIMVRVWCWATFDKLKV